MGIIKRTLSFGKKDKTAAPGDAATPNAAAANAPPAAQTSAGRRITRSLSFNSSRDKTQKSKPDAAPAKPGTRVSAADFAAGARIPVASAPPEPAPSGSSKPIRRAASFGRTPRKPAEPDPLAEIARVEVQRKEQKQLKQAIAATDLQRYLEKMTEGEACPEGDADSRTMRPGQKATPAQPDAPRP